MGGARRREREGRRRGRVLRPRGRARGAQRQGGRQPEGHPRAVVRRPDGRVRVRPVQPAVDRDAPGLVVRHRASGPPPAGARRPAAGLGDHPGGAAARRAAAGAPGRAAHGRDRHQPGPRRDAARCRLQGRAVLQRDGAGPRRPHRDGRRRARRAADGAVRRDVSTRPSGSRTTRRSGTTGEPARGTRTSGGRTLPGRMRSGGGSPGCCSTATRWRRTCSATSSRRRPR